MKTPFQLLLLFGLLSGCSPQPPIADPSALQQALDLGWNESGALGVNAARNDWAGASGYGDSFYNSRIDPYSRMRAASITKMFTATVVLQLVDEGILSLNDSLEDWLPGTMTPGAAVRISHLLSHTSGIPDFLSDPDINPFGMTSYWQPEAIVAQVADCTPGGSPTCPLQYAPGESSNYSNTNYILLGMIIEAATGSSFASEVRSRIINPIGLQSTFIEGFESGTLVYGFEYSSGYYYDVTTSIHPTLTWSAGGVISNPSDLVTFGRALLRGDLLSPASLTAMMTQQSIVYGSQPYGYGVFLLPGGFGHDGSVNGFSSHLSCRPATDECVAVLANTWHVAVTPIGAHLWNASMIE